MSPERYFHRNAGDDAVDDPAAKDISGRIHLWDEHSWVAETFGVIFKKYWMKGV